MRKLLLTTTIALPLAFGSAFAQDSTMPADPAADPMADPAADTGAADAEKAALEAEMASSDKVAREQAMNELRIEWITDATVTAPDGTSIGGISDLIVDGETGQMIAAIIGVGGFLGIGAKQIAVPWDQLVVNYDAQEVTSDLTKEEAEAAPEYVFRDREAAPGAAGDGTLAPAPATDATDAPATDTTTDPMADPVADPASDPAADPMADPAALDGTDTLPPTDPTVPAVPAAPADDTAPAGEAAPAN